MLSAIVSVALTIVGIPLSRQLLVWMATPDALLADAIATDAARTVLLPLWNTWYFLALYAGTVDGGRGYQARLLDLEVRRLSAGQRRRLSLARLLASPRSLWLLDEPLSPLDAGWRVRFGEMMNRHLADGGMIVAAVHDPLPIPSLPLEIAAPEDAFLERGE